MSDPTVQGTPPGTRAARYSLSEIDAQCRKAARGAGCPWGLAEEAGKAARWLAARALSGPEALAALLDGPRDCPCAGAGAGAGAAAGASTGAGATAGTSAGAIGPSCALRLGATLGDRIEQLAAGETVSLSVAQPLLVLGQVGPAAAATGVVCTLEWEGVRASCGPDGLVLEGAGETLSPAARLRVSTGAVASAGVAAAPIVRVDRRSRPVDAGAWAALERFAARTYVPASEASRLAGAGAGIRDDD